MPITLKFLDCERYKYIDQESIVFPSIVGGTRAGEYEYPHMVSTIKIKFLIHRNI